MGGKESKEDKKRNHNAKFKARIVTTTFIITSAALKYYFSGYHERNRYIKKKTPPPGGFSKTTFSAYGASNIPWHKERFPFG